MLAPCITALLFLATAQTQTKTGSGACFTPNSTEGVCVNLQQCPSVYAMANDFNTPMIHEVLTFLIQSQCGLNGTNPKATESVAICMDLFTYETLPQGVNIDNLTLTWTNKYLKRMLISDRN